MSNSEKSSNSLRPGSAYLCPRLVGTKPSKESVMISISLYILFYYFLECVFYYFLECMGHIHAIFAKNLIIGKKVIESNRNLTDISDSLPPAIRNVVLRFLLRSIAMLLMTISLAQPQL